MFLLKILLSKVENYHLPIRKIKLNTEEVSQVKFITEGKGAKKKMYIEGVFLQGDIKNRNGRMYPVNTLAKDTKSAEV